MSIDLTTLDAEAIRALIAQGRSVLRDRRLIPDAHLRKENAPGLSDVDLVNIRRAARQFGIRPATLADEVLALRTSPQAVTLRSREGDEARLTPLIRVHWGKSRSLSGTTLAGTGHLGFDLRRSYASNNPQAAPGEYVPLGRDGAPDFERLYGPGFIRSWESLPALPTAPALRIILAMAGHQDTPQEALLAWCVGAFSSALGSLAENGGLIDILFGRSLASETLADVLRPALARVREGANPKDLLQLPRYYNDDWYSLLLRACELFLVGTNLIVPDLESDPVLAVPLAELWQRYRAHERAAALKAGQLRRAIVERFGFTEIKFRKERAWARAAEPLPEHEWEVDTFLRKTPNVVVTESCKVYVQGEYRCVVEGRSADLPHADQVVRRLLGVATQHRERISTLNSDLPILESLFAGVAGATIWDLATGTGLASHPENTEEMTHEHEPV